MKQGRRFRGALNIAMIVSVAGTLPYVFSGGSRYRHEVLGTMAFVLMIYHCMLNRFWFCKVLKKGKMKKNTKRQKLLYAVNMVLAITAVILLISSIMISGYVFGFLHIPYWEFWHYVHFVSGIVFILLLFIHVGLHVR